METVGRYQILKQLGKGGMGKVLLAEDPILGRQVAIKLISDLEEADGTRSTWLRTRFLQEARAIAILSHPHIVAIHDIGEHAGDAYIVMEYVAGPSLAALRRSRGIARPELVRMVRETAAGLDYAHSKNVVHRDIKPANLLIDAGGCVKIADFGLAKLSASTQSTSTGRIAGTLQYMAPEQLQSKKVDGYTDQYALAAMAYEILTGHPVFEAESIGALGYQICNDAPRPPQTLAPDLPVTVNPIFERALAKNPAERFPTCAAFAAALAESLGEADSATETITSTISMPALVPAAGLTKPRRFSRWQKEAIRAGIVLMCGLAVYIGAGFIGTRDRSGGAKPAGEVTAQPAPAVPHRAEPTPEPPVAAPKPVAKEATVSTPAKPAPPPAPPPAPVAQSGSLVWTGELAPGQEIDLGASSAAGSVEGVLPGVPVKIIDVHPSSLQIVTPPGPGNGWRHLVVRNDDRKQVMIIVRWAAVK